MIPDIYLGSFELIPISKNKVTLKDKDNNYYQVEKTDPRYLSGELVHMTVNNVTVKDEDGNTFSVNITDTRYLSGELKHHWKDRKHSNETKEKMRKSKNIGTTNSQFGTCWITKDNINKKIKKEELDYYLNNGWTKGRKIKPN